MENSFEAPLAALVAKLTLFATEVVTDMLENVKCGYKIIKLMYYGFDKISGGYD